jgi:NAD-dependent deacetylase
MQVYPAASLMHYAPENTHIYFIDPKPTIESSKKITVIAKTATKGVKELVDSLITI